MLAAHGSSCIDIGRPSRAVPVTPPCVRVRTRRFGLVEPSNRASVHQMLGGCRAFSIVLHRGPLGPFTVRLRGFTPTLGHEGQLQLGFCRLRPMSRTAYWPLQSVRAFGRSFPVRRAQPFLPFRASVSIEWTDCICLLCPLLTSATRSGHLAVTSVARCDTRQTSRGKFDRLRRTPAGFTTSALDGLGLRDCMPTRPPEAASYPIPVRRAAALFHAAFRPHLAVTPWRFASTSPPSGCAGDFHPQAVEHARHTCICGSTESRPTRMYW
jgi:hypothetical protein